MHVDIDRIRFEILNIVVIRLDTAADLHRVVWRFILFVWVEWSLVLVSHFESDSVI